MTIAYNSAYIKTETLNLTFAQQAVIVYFDAERMIMVSSETPNDACPSGRVVKPPAAVLACAYMVVQFNRRNNGRVGYRLPNIPCPPWSVLGDGR